jgi:rhamnogalacturonyl hydrolase YesR
MHRKMENMFDLEKSIKKLEMWIEEQDYKGYDPFDGLSSFLRPLAFRNLFAERILQQTVRQCPLNLRPFLGVRPQQSPVGRGYMAAGYLKMYEISGHHDYTRKAMKCLDWLIKNRSSGNGQYAWGNHFDYVSRTGPLSRYEPTIVWTSLIGQSFLDAYEIMRRDQYLKVATGVCEWILALPREKTGTGTCLSYVASHQSSIHNSNMLGAAMLARTARITGDDTCLPIAKEAVEYSCSRQLPNGAWYYGDEANQHWIDNFHTGYNLASLKCYMDNAKDRTYENNLSRGFAFFRRTLFEEDGRPKYYHNRLYPIDIQSVAQAIETLVAFADYDESSLQFAAKVADWAIAHMQDPGGSFFYRLYPLNIKAKTPMIHWGQTTTYKSLAVLLAKK